eukprot:3911448-Pyramimonas_sp.AAC.1
MAIYHHYRLMSRVHVEAPQYAGALKLVEAARLAVRLPLRGVQRHMLRRSELQKVVLASRTASSSSSSSSSSSEPEG